VRERNKLCHPDATTVVRKANSSTIPVRLPLDRAEDAVVRDPERRIDGRQSHTRQQGRDREPNVVDSGHSATEILAGVARQLANGRCESDPMYGNGRAGEAIADCLVSAPLTVEKRLTN
jgi:hypothetical protein